MAEFCLECWNSVNETNDDKRKYILSKDLYLCEECGEWKSIIIAERKGFFLSKIKWLILYFLDRLKKQIL